MPLSAYDQYEFRDCPKCGIPYAAPKEFMAEARKDPSITFYCPNGHGRHFSESETDKLRRERDLLMQEQARLLEQRAEAEERATRAERNVKKLTKRAAAGTCPCCQRTFSNMAEHMKHQHPEFVADTGAKVVPIKRAAR